MHFCCCCCFSSYFIIFSDCQQYTLTLENPKRIDNYKGTKWELPGGPVVKTLPSNAGGVGLIPGWGDGIPQASGPKDQNIKTKQNKKNRGNVVTNSIKTLKK